MQKEKGGNLVNEGKWGPVRRRVNKADSTRIHLCGLFLPPVNNAGVAVISPLECFPINKAQQMMDVNFFGTLRLTKAVLPGMKARKTGHIIQCSSEHGVIGIPFTDVYTATKFAMEGFTECLAPMLRQFNVRYTFIQHIIINSYHRRFKGVSFEKNCGAASVEELYIKKLVLSTEMIM